MNYFSRLSENVLKTSNEDRFHKQVTWTIVLKNVHLQESGRQNQEHPPFFVLFICLPGNFPTF